MNEIKIDAPLQKIRMFCKSNHIRKLSFFGSVIRDDFRKESDVDILAEFGKGFKPGYFGLARMERELTAILGCKKVDLRTPDELSRYFRNEVVSSAKVYYAETG